MWTLQQYQFEENERPWPLAEDATLPHDFVAAGGIGSLAFLSALVSFVRKCQGLGEFQYALVDELVESAEAIEEAVRELHTAPILRFSVVMAIEDFVKKTMSAKEDQLRSELARKQGKADSGDLPHSVRAVEHAALVVTLACEAAWNASKTGIRWDPSDLDLPEE